MPHELRVQSGFRRGLAFSKVSKARWSRRTSQEIYNPMKRSLLTLGLIAAGATAANAYHPSGSGIDRRQGNQEWRIERGLRDGSLTRQEYARLKREQQRIEALERWPRRDGVITPYERQQIRAAQ